MNTKIGLKEFKTKMQTYNGDNILLSGVQYVVDNEVVYVKIIEAVHHYGSVDKASHPGSLTIFLRELKENGRKYIQLKGKSAKKMSMFITVEDAIKYLDFYSPKNPNTKFKKAFEETFTALQDRIKEKKEQTYTTTLQNDLFLNDLGRKVASLEKVIIQKDKKIDQIQNELAELKTLMYSIAQNKEKEKDKKSLFRW